MVAINVIMIIVLYLPYYYSSTVCAQSYFIMIIGYNMPDIIIECNIPDIIIGCIIDVIIGCNFLDVIA